MDSFLFATLEQPDAVTELNPRYDEARPDLVLVTMGADDVKFANIISDCITSDLTSLNSTCTLANPGSAVQHSRAGGFIRPR